MGMVIEFPRAPAASGKALRRAVATDGRTSAQVVILPVIRIERYESQPAEIFAPVRDSGRKRRRRAAR